MIETTTSPKNIVDNQSTLLDKILLNKVLIIFSALCIGLGISFFIASNWDNLSTFQKFGLLEIVLVITTITAFIFYYGRVICSLLAVFIIGGILALFAQTYSATNDPWLLFAVWALFILPFALAAKHQIIWGCVLLLIFTSYNLYFASSYLLADISYMFTKNNSGFLYRWFGLFIITLCFYPFSVTKKWLGKFKSDLCFNIAINLTLIFGLLLLNSYRLLYFIVLIAVFGLFFILKRKNLSTYISIMILADIVILFTIVDAILHDLFYSDTLVFPCFILFITSVGLLLANLKLLEWLTDRLDTNQEIGINYSHYFKLIIYSIGSVITVTLFLILISIILLISFQVKTSTPWYIVGLILFILGVWISVSKQYIQSEFLMVLSFVNTITGLALLLGTYLVNTSKYYYVDEIDWIPVLDQVILIFTSVTLILAIFSKTKWLSYLYAFLGFFVFSAININLLFTFSLSSILFSYAKYIAIVLILLIYLSLHYQLFPQYKDKLSILLTGGSIGVLLGLIINTGSTFLINVDWSPTTSTTFSLLEVFTFYLKFWLNWLNLGLLVVTYYFTCQQLTILKNYKFGLVLLIFIIFNFIEPTLSLVFILLLLALTTNHKILVNFAIFTMLWILGAFYYSNNGFLIEKAYLLIAIGIVLFFAHRLQRESKTTTLANKTKSITFWGDKPIVIGILLCISVGSCLAVMNQQIISKENLKHNGEKILLKLAPLDPRSLVQGDYMALNFELTGDYTKGHAYLDIDQDNVAHLKREAITNEKYMQLKLDNYGRWSVPARAWFFKEGDAKKWQSAKYGIFAVGANGESILVGMADKNKKPIIADKDK